MAIRVRMAIRVMVIEGKNGKGDGNRGKSGNKGDGNGGKSGNKGDSEVMECHVYQDCVFPDLMVCRIDASKSC